MIIVLPPGTKIDEKSFDEESDIDVSNWKFIAEDEITTGAVSYDASDEVCIGTQFNLWFFIMIILLLIIILRIESILTLLIFYFVNWMMIAFIYLVWIEF